MAIDFYKYPHYIPKQIREERKKLFGDILEINAEKQSERKGKD